MTGKIMKDRGERKKVVEDLDHSYIVEAGAGTGKTSLLLERVKNILLHGKAHLSEIVIITFTEKAAAELKMRLRNTLEKEHQKLSQKGFKKEEGFLAQALEEFERGNISTIHSFAASMLKERPIEAKVDPQFEVADALTFSLLFDDLWKSWLEKEIKACAPALKKALRFGIRLNSLKDIAREIVNNRDLYEGRPSKSRFSLLSFIEKFEKDVITLIKIGEKHCLREGDKGYQQILQLHRYLEALKKMREDDQGRLIFEMTIKKKGKQDNWKPKHVCAEVKSIFEKMGNEIKDSQQKIAQEICSQLADWLGGFLLELEFVKRNRGYLDFEDLLIRTRDMLKENKEARRYFQDRFKYIFVDEFQDTDPLQTEIVFFLAEEIPETREWNKVKVRTGKLFIVGDPKQSIYRFRRADIEIYDRAKKALLKRGKRADIFVNFRSVPSIINWVNITFSDLIRKEGDHAFQPEYTPIQADRDEIPGPASVIMIAPPPHLLESLKNIAELRELESRYVASYIKTVIDQRKWQIQKKRNGDLKEARYSDFAILFRKTTGIEHYEEAFRSFDIPYRIVGSKYFYKRQEVVSLLSVMRAIDNPSDEIAIIAALRSEFYGHSDEELFLFKENGGNFNYMKNERIGDTASVSLELLRQLHAKRFEKSIPLLLMDLFHQTKVIELNYLKPQGEQRVANLLKIIDTARMHEKTELSNFRSFTKWLDEMQIEEREAEESPILEEDDDAVRMMTIHKAKGLEFPFVILGMLEAGGKKRDSFLVDRAKGRFEFALGDLKPEKYEELKVLEEIRADSEEKRIFYVAATRAREKLILPLFTKKKKEGLITYLEGKIPDQDKSQEGKERGGAAFLQESSPVLKPKEIQPFKGIFYEKYLQGDFSKIIKERENWLNHLSEMKKKAESGLKLKSATSIKEENLLNAETGIISREGRAVEIGKTVHAILSEIDLARPKNIEKWLEFKTAHLPDQEIAEEVFTLVRNGLDMTTIKEAADQCYYREVPFSIGMNDTVLEGSLDLLYEKEGCFIAADYKTDKVKTESEIDKRMEQYEIQAAVYAFALSIILKKNIKEIRFLFLNSKNEKVIKVDGATIEKGRSLIANSESKINFET